MTFNSYNVIGWLRQLIERRNVMAVAVDFRKARKEPPTTPYEFIEAWGTEHITDVDGRASLAHPDTRREVERALHAIQEFMVQPLLKQLKAIVAGVSEDGIRRIPEDERPVGYADIGRLITLTDGLRLECSYLLDDIAKIALLAHEDLRTIAEGYIPDGILNDKEWSERLELFHGLDRRG